LNREKFMGIILGVVGVVLLVGGLYMAMSYMGAIMNVMIEFVTANSGAISKCGVSIPNVLMELKDQVATTILPLIYLGIPVATVIIALVMFVGGYFYGKGSLKDELNKEMRQQEEVEQEVERRVSKKARKSKKEPKEEPEEEEPEEEEED